ncbi:nucleotidyltransferase domain-containing protein [Candidatus Parvarchaeota archaeon]|uniref:Nucleotidyltransferase domain-containing protein n=1 Tax=Candidatus Acidifodinimicrobium mancum TaxID=2898728 RepID=A0A8T3UQE2_9ARCH|nr:nucleotidyltransferase domain-containing protein [Candidatus Acidifodinimicrobium mancum]
MGKWKQTLLKEDAYKILKEAKENAVKLYGKKMSFGDIIKESLNKELAISLLDDSVRAYLQAYIRELSENNNVIGAVLFGSLVKRTWDKYSDIDLFIVVKDNSIECLHYTDKIDKKLYPMQKEIFEKGYGLYVSPLIVKVDSLNENRMIYNEIRKNGIILLDKDNIIRNFMYNTKKTSTTGG